MVDTSKGVPQFATAEYAPNAQKNPCAACRRPISGPYFMVNAARVCGECADKIQAQVPKDSHAAFVRSLVFGIGGAVIGFLLYVIVALATGLMIGFVSLAVGFIIGKAMHMGSGGVGGRRYQVVAVLLTYLAVSMSAVPIAIQQFREHHAQPQAAATGSAQAPDAQAPAPKGHVNVGKAVGLLALLGIASPFLALKDPTHGLIGLIILFVGMRFAWRFTAGRVIRVSGPHAPAPAGAV
jgi:hypothetical protein